MTRRFQAAPVAAVQAMPGAFKIGRFYPKLSSAAQETEALFQRLYRVVDVFDHVTERDRIEGILLSGKDVEPSKIDIESELTRGSHCLGIKVDTFYLPSGMLYEEQKLPAATTHIQQVLALRRVLEAAHEFMIDLGLHGRDARDDGSQRGRSWLELGIPVPVDIAIARTPGKLFQ